MKKAVFLLVCVFSFTVNSAIAACQPALDASDPNFCSSFTKAVYCYCSVKGYGDSTCGNMSLIYSGMMAGSFFSLTRACNSQTDSAPQTCIDNWTCYREGGKLANGKPCSGTGAACPSS